VGNRVLIDFTEIEAGEEFELLCDDFLQQRPVLPDTITCSLPKLKPGQAANVAQLYEAYTELWLAYGEEKGRTLIACADKRVFMQELALEMLRRGKLSIHYSQLPERVCAHFHLERATEIDYFTYNILTCPFLNRDSMGNYCFVHKSFQEFFVAQWLAPRLMDASAPEMYINEEIRSFVRNLLAEADWPPPIPEGIEVPERMVWVPPGPFIMGTKDEGGTRVIRLERGFFVARTPVTNAEYACFVGATKCKPPRHWGDEIPPEELRDHPVVYTSWHDAVAYAQWAGVRLLTEQEWEKAARGIDGRIYPWGDEFDPTRCNTAESDIGITTPVGWYSPGGDSPCSCADMAGNLWEWTASKWEPSSMTRVVRGGSFGNHERSVHSAFRGGEAPSSRLRSWGCRVGVTAPSSSLGTTQALYEDEGVER